MTAREVVVIDGGRVVRAHVRALHLHGLGLGARIEETRVRRYRRGEPALLHLLQERKAPIRPPLPRCVAEYAIST